MLQMCSKNNMQVINISGYLSLYNLNSKFTLSDSDTVVAVDVHIRHAIIDYKHPAGYTCPLMTCTMNSESLKPHTARSEVQ